MFDSFLKKSYKPLTLSIDFRDPLWAVTRTEVKSVLLLSIAADLLAQYSVGDVAWWTVIVSFILPLACFTLPSRLGIACGHLFLVQALGSIALVLVGEAVTDKNTLVVAIAAILWQVWCMAAGLRAVALYIRTPVHQMRKYAS